MRKLEHLSDARVQYTTHDIRHTDTTRYQCRSFVRSHYYVVPFLRDHRSVRVRIAGIFSHDINTMRPMSLGKSAAASDQTGVWALVTSVCDDGTSTIREHESRMRFIKRLGE